MLLKTVSEEEKILLKNLKMFINNSTDVMKTTVKGLKQRGFIMEHELCSHRIVTRLRYEESKLTLKEFFNDMLYI